MIVSDIYSKVGFATPIDEIVVASQQEYYAGTPHYSEVRDIVKDNGKLVILI